MAYMKRGLTGDLKKRLGRAVPRDRGVKGDVGYNPHRVEQVLRSKRGRFDLSKDVMPIPSGPSGFPGMGDIRNNPPWQTQQPGFYDEPSDGPIPPMPSRTSQPFQGTFGNFEQASPMGIPEGGIDPRILKLIQELMSQRGISTPWEGTMDPSFGRAGPGNRAY